MGPYDAIVLATGVRATVHIHNYDCSSSNNNSNNIFVVGDARYTRWWDFGQHRIQQGANQAMLDGWDLATTLMSTTTKKKTMNPSNNDKADTASNDYNWTHNTFNVPDKYRLRTKYRYASSTTASWSSCQWVVLLLLVVTAIWIAITSHQG